jgi:MFS family permease
VTETETATPPTRQRLPRSFWALWSCQLINRVGGFVLPFLVLYLTQEQHLTAAMAGAIAAAVGAGSVVSSLLGGWMTDHVGRRKTLIAGFLGTAGAMIALGSFDSLPLIWVAAFLVGVAADLFRPASSALVADLLGPEARVRAYGLLFWAVNLGFSISTVSAGVIASFGFGLLFWLNAAACVIAAAIIWRVVPETRPAPDPDEPRRGFLAVALKDTVLLALLAASVLYASLYFQAYASLPLAMAADGLSNATYGIVIALNGAVIVVAQPFLIRVLPRFDRSRVIAVSMLLVGIGFGAGAFVDSAVGYGASVVVWTIGEIGVSSVLMALYADLAPVDLRGQYLGLAGVTWSIGTIVGPLAGTAVFGTFGPAALWIGCAVVGAICCVAQLLIAPSLRRRALVPA